MVVRKWQLVPLPVTIKFSTTGTLQINSFTNVYTLAPFNGTWLGNRIHKQIKEFISTRVWHILLKRFTRNNGIHKRRVACEGRCSQSCSVGKACLQACNFQWLSQTNHPLNRFTYNYWCKGIQEMFYLINNPFSPG